MANGDLEIKWPISQSFTRLRTLQKLGLGDFDLARRPPRLIPLFRLVAFRALEAFTAPTGVLLRLRTALAATFGESVGTVRLSDIPPSTLSLKNSNIRLGNVFCYFRSHFNSIAMYFRSPSSPIPTFVKVTENKLLLNCVAVADSTYQNYYVVLTMFCTFNVKKCVSLASNSLQKMVFDFMCSTSCSCSALSSTFFTSIVKSKVALLITFSSNVRFEQYMHFVRNCPSANSFQGLPVPAAVMIEEKTRLLRI